MFPAISLKETGINVEYQSYRLMWKHDQVHKEFEKCAKGTSISMGNQC